MASYPESLPGPVQPFPFAPRERRVASPMEGLTQLRGRSREQIVDARGVRWRYTPAEMEVFRNWWKSDLVDGLLWFDVMLPGFGGWQQRMARFVSGSRREHLAAGIYEVTADLEINGSRVPPRPRPVLLMHWDGDFVDSTGITTFAPEGSGYDFVAGEPGFGQAVSAISNGRAAGSSSRDLAIGTKKFTIEGRSRFSPGQIGGFVLGKNYWSSYPGEGVFRNDWAVSVDPDTVAISWSGQVIGTAATFPEIVGEWFTWSISDDNGSMFFHVNGELVGTVDAAARQLVTPPVTPGSSISVLNLLQGFSGTAPDWGGSFYQGKLDELRMWLDVALYGPEGYEPAAGPFSP